MMFPASPKIDASDLHKPLLGDEEEQQQEQVCVDDERCDDQDDEEYQSPSAEDTWCDSILAWFVLPCLLWLDFCLVLRHPAWRHDLPAATNAMASIHMSFVMFIISSFLYRKTIDDEWAGVCGRSASIALLLAPEFAMNVMLVLIFFDKVVAAYLMLLAVILALSLVVVVCSAFRLFCVREVVPASRNKDLSEEDDEWEVEVQVTC
jgi:hypothetical protein